MGHRIIFYIVICISLIFSACDEKFQEGFVSDDAYHVVGKGRAAEEHRNKNSMIISKIACEGAVLDAQGKAIIKFSEAGLDTVIGKVDEAKINDIIVQNFSGTIKRGRIVRYSFDESSLECVVLYEIKEEGLRNKVTTASKN